MWQSIISPVASPPLPAADSDHGPLTVRQVEQDIEEGRQALFALGEMGRSLANTPKGAIAEARYQRGLRWLELAVAQFQRRSPGPCCDPNIAINVAHGLNNLDAGVSAAKALLQRHDASLHQHLGVADGLVQQYICEGDPWRMVQALEIAAAFDRRILSGADLEHALLKFQKALSMMETGARPRIAASVRPAASPVMSRMPMPMPMPMPAPRPARWGLLGARARTQDVAESASDRMARLRELVRSHIDLATPVGDQGEAWANDRCREDAWALSSMITGGEPGAKDAMVDLLAARLPRSCVPLLKEVRWGHEMGDEVGPISAEHATAVACSIAEALSRSGHLPGFLPVALLRRMVLCAADKACAADWHPLRGALSAAEAVAALAAARAARGGESAARGELIKHAFKNRLSPEDCLSAAIAVYLFGDAPIARYLASYCEGLLGPRVDRAGSGGVSPPLPASTAAPRRSPPVPAGSSAHGCDPAAARPAP